MSNLNTPTGVRTSISFDLSRCVVFDVECYEGHWCVGFGYFLKSGQWYVKHVEDRHQLDKILRTFAARGKILVGYNSQKYDVPMIRAILDNRHVYGISQLLIEGDWSTIKKALYGDHPLPRFRPDHIDISARLRRGKYPPSLKFVAAAMGRPVLEELPYPPDADLEDDQWIHIKEYNIIDLGHTWELLTRVAPDLEALASLSNEVGQDLRSVPAPGVVERVFVDAYYKAHGFEPERITPPHEILYQPLDGVFRPRTPEAIAWYDRVCNQPIPIIWKADRPEIDERPLKTKFMIGNLLISTGVGGLHSIDKSAVYYSDEEWDVVSIDVASFYPSLIATKGIRTKSYGDTGLDLYRKILTDRLRIKGLIKGAATPELQHSLKIQSDGLKLVLNSTFGKCGDPYSTLFDPQAFVEVTITGQLMLIDLIERCQEGGVEVVSANTDGLFVRVRKGTDHLDRVIVWWEGDTGMKLEVEPLGRLAISATNNYAAIDPAGKLIKAKGDAFKADFGDCSNPSSVQTPNALIVGQAVIDALLYDVPPEVTIRGCQDPGKFTRIVRKSGKVDAQYLADSGNTTEEDLPKVCRYYFAKESRKTIKHRLQSGVVKTAPKATSVGLAMDISDGKIWDDLDRSRYIKEARAIIQSVAGYRHFDPRFLDANPLALEVFDAGLSPCPKWGGKNVFAGADAKRPTWLWDYSRTKTIGSYTQGLLVVDIDVFEKWNKAVTRRKIAGGWESLEGCLVSYHGDATPEFVRTGLARGKLIFRLNVPADHRLVTMRNPKSLKTWGVEVFAGQGIPSVLGWYSEDDQYKLDGTLGDAPGWLVEMLTPRAPRPRKAKAVVGEVTEEVLSSVTDRLVELEPRLSEVEWENKTTSDDRLIRVGHCPAHEGTDKDLHVAVGSNGVAYAKCKHASCTLIPPLNLKLKADDGAGDLPVATEGVFESIADPHRLGRAFLDGFRVGNWSGFRYHRGDHLAWGAGAYRSLQEEDVRGRISRTIKREFDEENQREIEAWVANDHCNTKGEEIPCPSAKKVTRNVVSDTTQAVESMALISSHLEAPSWIGGNEPFEAAVTLPLKNALVHLPSAAAALELGDGRDVFIPPTPTFFTTYALDFGFDILAPEPVEWLKFLKSIWPDDQASIDTLQEWMGYLLTPDTSLHKMGWFIGPSRSGRGTIGRVITSLIGAENCATPTLNGLGTNFGLSALIGKPVAVIGDARLSSKADVGLIVERILSIVGEDSIEIDRKHKTLWRGRLRTRFSISSNELPRFHDPSGALLNRYLVFRLTRSFVGKEDRTLDQKLAAELPSILLWAIKGWSRLKANGEFVQPDSGKSLIDQVKDISSPIGHFLRENYTIGPGCVPVPTIFGQWKRWCEDRNRNPGNEASFGRDLRTIIPNLEISHPWVTDKNGKKSRVRHYEGLTPIKED